MLLKQDTQKLKDKGVLKIVLEGSVEGVKKRGRKKLNITDDRSLGVIREPKRKNGTEIVGQQRGVRVLPSSRTPVNDDTKIRY